MISSTKRSNEHQRSAKDDGTKKRRRSEKSSSRTLREQALDSDMNESHAEDDMIEDDDLCPVCRLLLYRPVTTTCRHTLCESCMAHWADVSVSSQMTIVNVNEQATDFDAVSELEARCPMCRTQTNASLNNALIASLKDKYPTAYAERENEENRPNGQQNGGKEIQTLTLYIGNSHKLTEPSPGSSNMHDWTFFVRPSRTEIIEEVQIVLVSRTREQRLDSHKPCCTTPPNRSKLNTGSILRSVQTE